MEDLNSARLNQPASGGDERAAVHQLAFELGGTEAGEYLLDADDLDKVINAAWQARAALPVREAVAEGYVLASKATLSRCAYNIAYATFNLADRTLEGLKSGVIESTDPATSALIAEREIRALLEVKP